MESDKDIVIEDVYEGDMQSLGGVGVDAYEGRYFAWSGGSDGSGSDGGGDVGSDVFFKKRSLLFTEVKMECLRVSLGWWEVISLTGGWGCCGGGGDGGG